MADLGNAMEKLKQMMSTDEGKENIQNILSNLNTDGMDLSKLGSMFGGGNAGGSDDVEIPVENIAEENSSPLGNIDMNSMLKMQKMFSMMNGGGSDGASGGGNRHASMLNSLKPYLSDGRKGKLDMAAKLMSLAKFAPLFKDMM